MEIKNKVAIVTGGIGGIGLVTVQHLIRSKIQFVAIIDLPKSDSEAAVANLSKLNKEFGKGSYQYYSCDLTNIQEFRAIYEKVIALKKYVDILINAAGILNDNAMNLCINVNFTAVVNSSMIAIEHMRKDKGGKGGVVVNVASIAGIVDFPYNPIYNATKHAVVAFARSLKPHNKIIGVRVVCICPGVTDTGLVAFDHLYKSLFDFIDPKIVDDFRDKVCCQSPDNVASAITKIILKGKDGAVWVVENDDPPYAVREMLNAQELRVDL
ncbi:alcohol dehydrogenase [Nasonia vitripennis]|uniref:Alcohol dehydrogenase n=1 Tax=Nasonia vitripennis TaxID=7425 RepID=A0A7M7G6Z1_NASVI|nr:alcohol dehydrogenase [Nasonia vitripennis]